MVQFVENAKQPKLSTAQQLGRGLGAAGESLAQSYSERLQGQKRQQELQEENEAIMRETGIDMSGITGQKQREEYFKQAIQGKREKELEGNKQQGRLGLEGGKQTNRLALEGMKQQGKQIGNEEKSAQGQVVTDALNRLTGMDLSGLTPQMQTEFLKKHLKTPEHDKIRDLLIKEGVEPEEAELYSYLTIGGQTELVKNLLESKERGRGGSFKSGVGIGEISENGPQQKESFDSQFKKHIAQQDLGIKPSEKVSREKERYDTGLKQYQEAGTKLRGMARDKERLDILETLSNSKKLPKDLERLNVDEKGALRFPFLASPESQRFVKTLNEFSSGAKDTFGSRVTNFDLSQYMTRYPTLLNSGEGRRQLIQQMKIVNDINSLYYKNLKDVYDKAGGVRKLDADAAERFAELKSEDKLNSLIDKFNIIGEFPTRPSASEFKGKKIEDTETGEIFISDGTDWIPQE
jgi:hypothetical protein